jgi:decaprenyl-phosphate phosphoribosyltransferase
MLTLKKISRFMSILRPTQWLKNLMLLFPPFLGGVIFKDGLIKNGIIPLISFCLASSATYILNDILDAASDAHHHTKKFRPIPSGQIKKTSAATLAFLIFVASIILGYRVSHNFLFFLLMYITVAVLYSMKLKEFPIVDLFCISAGFLFRLQAGGVAFGVEISEWLFLSVFLLSLFLSTGKRLCEKNSLGGNAGKHRKSLIFYPDGFLEGTMYMTGAAVLVTYTMYAIQRPALVYTVPICTFGLLRYILRVKSGLGGDPTESLLRDAPLFLVGLIWAGMVGWSIYGR